MNRNSFSRYRMCVFYLTLTIVKCLLCSYSLMASVAHAQQEQVTIGVPAFNASENLLWGEEIVSRPVSQSVGRSLIRVKAPSLDSETSSALGSTKTISFELARSISMVEQPGVEQLGTWRVILKDEARFKNGKGIESTDAILFA